MKQYLWKSFDFRGDSLELLDCFRGEPHVFFLDSSQYDPGRGRYSFIGFDPFDVFVHKGKDTLALLKKKFSGYVQENGKGFSSRFSPLTAGIIGCLGYDYGLHQEKIRLRADDDLNLPDCFFGFYDCILTIDHFTQKLYVTSCGLPEKNKRLREKRASRRLACVLKKLAPYFDGMTREGYLFSALSKNVPSDLKGNFSREQYLAAVRKAIDYISRGDIYQVNLSQRFQFGLGGHMFNPLRLYESLRRLSPSPFGGYLDCGGFQLISNSPERFLHLNNRVAQTRPMKGTRPRGKDARRDQELREEILNSAKEKAELLMITDLQRNDLGRVCDYGSVRVKEMRALEEYRYVFQATSTIEGVLSDGKDCFDLIRACFPGGSVTGCPKIRAMEIIEELEPTRRAMYTGSMGYINFGGNMDFNILIRTLLAYRGKLYFQAGGGIVADSTPEGEYDETLVKARAIRECVEYAADEGRLNPKSEYRKSKQYLNSNDINSKHVTIFLDGRMVRAGAALVDSLAPGVVQGKGVFETMRAHGGTIFALEDHFKRLFRGLKLLGIRSPYSKTRWTRCLHRTMQANRLKEARIRLSVWEEARRVRTAIVCQDAGEYSGKYQKGFRAVISDIRRKKTRFSHIKSLDYSSLRRAFKEAEKRGCDEAILLNNRRELIEGSRTNIFFIKDDVLYTPAVRCGCLNGITRRIVIRCARRMGISCRAAAVDVRELLRADEAFVTNSLMGVMPLTVVEGQSIGRGKAGPLTRKLSRAYRGNVHSACPSQGKSV